VVSEEKSVDLSQIKEESLTENLPDNTFKDCNLCVKGLDESIRSKDLFEMFSKFGDILSAKVAQDKNTQKSKCYGFVWFAKESSFQEALEASEAGLLPYKCNTFKVQCMRKVDMLNSVEETCQVIVSGFPCSYGEYDLIKMFEDTSGPETV